MASFSESGLLKKFEALNSSLQSIQTLSLWIIYHRKHCAQIVNVWFREFLAAKESKKLTFMYLANDVIQNSKKKGPEFSREFANVLKKAYEHLNSLNIDNKMRSGLLRILSVWEERCMYGSKFITELKATLEPNNVHNHVNKRLKTEVISEDVETKNDARYTLSPRTTPVDPPEPDDIIEMLNSLDNNTASSDADIRQRIASFPPEVSEVSLLSNLEDRESAERLCVQVDEAVNLLTEYNDRLSAELVDRKKLNVMLKDFMHAQKELLSQAEEQLEKFTDKLQKVYHVRQEMKSHIRNLPDLTQLPDVTGGLAPLPSAGDLFNSSG